MTFYDKHPDELSDIALYAGYAADTIRQAQDHLRKLAGFLGANGDFLRDSADMLGNAIDNEIEPHMHLALAAMESGVPQASLIAAHREAAAEFRGAP